MGIERLVTACVQDGMRCSNCRGSWQAHVALVPSTCCLVSDELMYLNIFSI
jgi:hypothetical protein